MDLWDFTRTDHQVDFSSANSFLETNLRMIRGISRNETRKDYIKGAIAKIVSNVIGEGINFQSQARKTPKSQTLDQKLNQTLEQKWGEWAKSGADIREFQHFNQLECLILRTVIVCGEVLIRLHRRPAGRSTIPLTLEVIEPDRLADERCFRARDGAVVRLGIEEDIYGKPVAYHLYQNHPGDYLFSAVDVRTSRIERVPAADIIHLFIPDRPGQSRGIPWLSGSLLRARYLSKLEEGELIKARATACISLFIQNNDPDVVLGQMKDNEPILELEPGGVFQLEDGQTIAPFAPATPTVGFDPFVRAMLRGISAGLGISYESLSNDYSQTSFSSARQSILQERDIYKQIQAWLIRAFREPLYQEWFVAATGLKVDESSSYLCCPKFIPRRWDWVDPSKDTKAKLDLLAAGLTSKTKLLAEMGLDYDEVALEIERERATAAKSKGEDRLLDIPPQQQRSATLPLIKVSGDRLRFSFSSEKPVERSWGKEILSHAPGDYNLERAGGMNFLWNHNPDIVLGKVEYLGIESKKGICEIRWSKRAEIEKYRQDVEDGILSNISFAYSIDDWQEIEQGTFSCKWTPLEISLVSVPADHTVGIGRTSK